jgi:hypothetical protein
VKAKLATQGAPSSALRLTGALVWSTSAKSGTRPRIGNGRSGGPVKRPRAEKPNADTRSSAAAKPILTVPIRHAL